MAAGVTQAKTHFGFKEINEHEKVEKVAAVFDTVANQYDIMNDFMSMGIHRLWKRFTLFTSGIRRGQKVLDLAGGTADMSLALAEKVGEQGEVWLTDINFSMLSRGRNRLIDANKIFVKTVQCDAEFLPFPDRYFDAITLAFGLRNMTRIDRALHSAYRVLKPGGQLIVLEFSKVTQPMLRKLYDAYSYQILPRLGKWITHSSESYQYLAESIRMHPDQQTLRHQFELAGFERCRYHNLSSGIVAIHRGYRL